MCPLAHVLILNAAREVKLNLKARASFSTTHAHTANVLDLAASVASPVAGAPRTAWAPRTARRKKFGPIVIIQSQRSWHGLRRCRRRCCSCVVSLRGRRPTMDYEVLPDFSGAKRPAVMQQCSSTHPSSDASIAAATLSVQPNAGWPDLLQVTQSASSRLSSSAVQAGTTSRTTRGVVRPGLPLLRPHVQMETILYNMGVGQQSQLLLVVAVMRRPARVRMVRCSFTRASEHACPMPTHASPHIAPPQCGAGGAVDAHPMRPFEVTVPCAVCSDFASWVGFLSERLRPARCEKT